MKCPKCGFQSFNYLATCKKCGRDLSQIRDKFRLGDPVLPETIDSHPVSAPPMPEDPFETLLPDEKDISTAANLASLPDEETDTALSEYMEDINTVDPELAETLDPDMDWSAEGVSVDSFDLGDELAEPVLSEEESLPKLADETIEPVGSADPEPEAVPVYAAEHRSEESFEDMAAVEEASDFSTSDLDFEDDADLDAWLLDGEEPSWRRAVSEPLSEEDLADPLGDDFGSASVGGDFPPFDDLQQAELPFENDMKKASIVARMLAFVLDTGLLALLLALFVMAGEYLRRGTGVFEWPQPQQLADQVGPYFLVFFGLSFGYFTLFHYLGGQTPGKMAGKLLVVDISGEPLQLSQAFLRTVGGLICLLPGGLGFCSMLLNREGRGWNDRLAGSIVVAAEDGVLLQGEE